MKGEHRMDNRPSDDINKMKIISGSYSNQRLDPDNTGDFMININAVSLCASFASKLLMLRFIL